MVRVTVTVPAFTGLTLSLGRQTFNNIQSRVRMFHYYAPSFVDGGNENAIKEPISHYYVGVGGHIAEFLRHQIPRGPSRTPIWQKVTPGFPTFSSMFQRSVFSLFGNVEIKLAFLTPTVSWCFVIPGAIWSFPDCSDSCICADQRQHMALLLLNDKKREKKWLVIPPNNAVAFLFTGLWACTASSLKSSLRFHIITPNRTPENWSYSFTGEEIEDGISEFQFLSLIIIACSGQARVGFLNFFICTSS